MLQSVRLSVDCPICMMSSVSVGCLPLSKCVIMTAVGHDSAVVSKNECVCTESEQIGLKCKNLTISRLNWSS